MALLPNEILIGSLTNPTFRYKNAEIQLGSAKGTFSCDVLGNELSVDTFSVIVRYNPDPDAPTAYSPVGKDAYLTSDNQVYLVRPYASRTKLYDMPYGTAVYWLVSDSFFAKGFLKSVERVSRYMYKLNCVSGVGVLNDMMHVGGLYNGTTVSSILSSIIGTAFAYSVAANVGNILVYGHLKYDTARNNLHQLLFAVGASMLRDSNGDYEIKYLSEVVKNVSSSRIALGGKTEYTNHNVRAEITEHAFLQTSSDETVVLFDNTGGTAADHAVVLFGDNAPVYDLQTTGTLVKDTSHVNYAIVSGVGTLTGKPYTHNTRIVSYGDGESVKRVTDNRLISFSNAVYLSKRVYNYYAYGEMISAKILLTAAERPGRYLSFYDSFGDLKNAYLQSADILVTTVLGANCKLIAGFTPGAGGKNYTKREFFGYSRSWTVPNGITQIRLVLIGGAAGGQGGYAGENGLHAISPQDPDQEQPGIYADAPMYTQPVIDHFYEDDPRYQPGTVTDIVQYYKDQYAPHGGAAGEPGEKAKYYVIDLTVEPGDVITVNCGVGGAGGEAGGGAGSAGTPTTAACERFGEKTSDDGLADDNGYYDPFSGNTYAKAGSAGVKGGDGGMTDLVDLFGWHGSSGYKGESVGTYLGGNGGTGVSHTEEYWDYYTITEYSASGGGGGGAAYGRAGGVGMNASVKKVGNTSWPKELYGGNGGKGADAKAPAKVTYGIGGTGGNGGGGGGNPGGLYAWINDDQLLHYGLETERAWFYKRLVGTPGVGGAGSVGGKGGDGCAMIYY